MTAISTKKKIWIDEHKIHSYEIDTKGNATLPILCRYMQESAWHHAENLGVGFSHLMKHQLIWVLSHQLIRINILPKWGEKIQIHTWPSGKARLSYLRDFKILNKQNDIVGIATTKWFTINLKSRKPENLDSYYNFVIEHNERVFSQELNKLDSPDPINQIKTFQVGFRDLDVNEHVNNIRYIEWILESFPLDFHKSHKLNEFEITFLTEALYNDELSVWNTNSENNTYYHSLRRNKDQKELCRARTQWEKIK